MGAAAIPVLTGIGVATNVIGTITAGSAAKKQARTQAQILAEQAAREEEIASENEALFRRQQGRVAAGRRAALGAAGVDPSTGSPLAVSEDFTREVELQALRIRKGGEIRATRLEQEAALTRAAGSAAQRGSLLSAAGRLARGGSLLISNFSSGNQAFDSTAFR